MHNLNTNLSGRRILVTAGPTWVRIDAVRHIANLSSGRTGLLIARRLADAGAEVWLLFGPGRCSVSDSDRTRMHVVDFVTYDDLHEAISRAAAARCFDALVHSAAVSDYRPISESTGKLPSGDEGLVLNLAPTAKIVDLVRPLDPDVLLVKFKLEVGRSVEELLAIAESSRRRSAADLVVANDLGRMEPGCHPAWILGPTGALGQTETTEALAQRLTEVLSDQLDRRGSRKVCSVPALLDAPDRPRVGKTV